MLFPCESLILFHYFRRWSDSLYFNYVNESFRALCVNKFKELILKHHFGRLIRNSFNWSSCGRRFKFVLITFRVSNRLKGWFVNYFRTFVSSAALC
ncbi:MAG: hypothetical protein ACTS4W_00660 [Candidatus Hodgkinia cicadicola]